MQEKWHFASLETIFIENRIYHQIEQLESWKEVISTIHKGLKPHTKNLLREVTDEDVARLCEIKIKRITKFDLDKAETDILKLEERIKQEKHHLSNLIDFVILDLEKEKIISDKFYSDSKSRSFIKRGYSLRKIRNFLVQKGIKQNYIKESISKITSDNSDQDFFSAIKLCKKRRIGPNREEDNRPLFYKKDISILARSGFDYETSKKVMDLSKNDYENFLKLL